MHNKYTMKNAMKAGLMTSALMFGLQMSFTNPANAQAGIFEVIHPEVEQGEIELEFLNGFGLSDVENGEERSVHELAIGYGFTDYWKLTAAVEIANPEGDDTEVEGFEFESLLLLAKGGHHDEENSDGHGHEGFTLGLFTALEIPREGGIDEGAFEIGPVIGAQLGEVEFIGNLFAEIPFEDGEDAGLSYATQIVLPISDNFGIGVENFGEFEGLFGERGDDVHFAGPGLYWDVDLPNGHKLEPRIAVLFGLNDNAPDAVLSFNLEYKIEPK